MISKIDNCMLDLLAYHERAVAEEKERDALKPWVLAANIMARAASLSERPAEPQGKGRTPVAVMEHKLRVGIKSHP